MSAANPRGFFKSTDGGVTWRKQGAGRRAHHGGDGVAVGTVLPRRDQGQDPSLRHDLPRSLDELFGTGTAARRHDSDCRPELRLSDSVQTLSVADERDDTGFYNVAFDKAMQSTGEMRYATAQSKLNRNVPSRT